jgi:prepilin-type N-terminal cleavage/methylation domain-containing protein
MNNQRGRTLIEMMVAAGIVSVLAVFTLRQVRAYSADAYLVGAGQAFKNEFRKARSMATRNNVYTAIRFEDKAAIPRYSIYVDGNFNGVRKEDIGKGVDVRVAGPFFLDGQAPGVRVGINPGTPAIPPEKGMLDVSDPIKFGVSDMLSFSPLGTATPGTFYLAGEASQAAVRVTAGTARVRLMLCRNGKWIER